MTPPKETGEASGKSGRRDELLEIAAGLFAERGLRATTVRDIADAAGILSGSLYHHFDSKESMVDEILRGFLDELFGRYRDIVASGLDSRTTLEALVTTSYEAIDVSHSAVAIYQDEAKHLFSNDRFGYLSERNTEFRKLWIGVLEAGVADGSFRPDIDVELVYRFMRDTVWVAVRWYRPGGSLSADTVAKQYLAIVLDGLTAPTTREEP
ncbi:MAG: TetR/AcrR family transcriptional regulator [Rhodococcus sp.]|nr:TetR/AcrR family transcriptional regulator [Rhodococcus sp. (in: high G+C Gram-positive bacteria)]